MLKFHSLNFILMLLVSFGCNNPKGGSVIAGNHTPLLQPPAAFSFTQIRAVDGSVKVVWQTSTRAASYEFTMSTDPNAITTVVPTCSNDIESCQLTGLDPNLTYYYSVKATNSAGTKVVTSVGRSRAVGSFDLISSTAGDGSIAFNWGASSNATSYNIVYGTVPGSYPSTVTGVTAPYTLTGLSNGTMYYARVVAVNGDNGYALSTTEASERPFGPLVAPQGLVATATPGVITLDWNDLGGATSYEIWDSTGSTLIGTSVTSSFTHNHGSNGTTYTYKVRGLNGFNGAYSSVVTARSIAAFAIASAVTGPLPGQVTVTWPGAVTGAAAFNIRYGSNPAALSSQVTNVTSPYVFSGLTGGLPYYFTVVATNAVGLGTSQNSSNQLSATPVAAISAPTGLTATAAPSGTTLNWTIVPGATQYNIYRGTSTGSYAFVSSSATNSFLDTGATPGSTYFYVVRSFNGLESSNSLEVSKQPIANFAFTSATVATFNSVNLVWATATGATGYDVLYGTSTGNYTSSSLNRTSPTTLTGLTPATTYYIVIRAKNAAGGGTTLLNNELTFTTSAEFPTVTITGFGLINNANRASYALSGTCTENTRAVTLNVGGVTGSTTCTALAWSLTMDVTAAPDSATLSIVATHTNSGGNSDTDSRTVIKDATNPTVAITSSPGIRITNEAAYVVSGTCSENTRTVSVSVGGINATPTCTALAWTTTINTTALADSASVGIIANHTDANGNTATQASTTVIKDTVAPSVAINSSPVINNANRAAYTLSGTCSETGRNVTVNVGSVSGSVTCTLLTWSATLNVTAVTDSAVVLVTADHSDVVGNPATQGSTLVVKDTVNPAVTITSSPTIINANKATYPISGTCSENSRTVSVSVGGVTATPTCSASAWSAVLDVTAVADGPSIAVSAVHTDAAGNSLTASTTVLKNTALPTVAITSSTAINNTNKAAYVISGTCSEPARTVSVNVGGVAGTPTCTASAWTTTLNVTAVVDSANVTITADHSDSVGNNANQASTTVVKDTVIPTVTITSSPTINSANRLAYTISGACSENARTVSVNVGGVTATPTCSALAWTATLNVNGVADGASVSATANHTDAVGNAATAASTTVVKDTVIPTVAITSSPSINNVNDGAYTVSGTCSENTRAVSVNVGGVTSTPTCTSLAWSATLNVSAVGDGGAISISANHTDAAGNAATQASTTVIKDTALPTVAITSTPVINNANRNAYTFSGTCSETGRAVAVAVGSTTGSVTCSLLTWSATLNVSGNADTVSLLITADHSDTAGNAAVQAATSSVKDTANPTVAITSSPAITNTNKAAYVVSGTCSENTRSVSINVGGVAATPTCTTLSWTATLDVTGVADSGSVAITANHNDSAGNTATQASTTVVKLTVLPTVAITSSPVINNTNRAAYTVSGTCSVNTRLVSVNVGGLAATPTCTASAWSTTLNVTSVGDNSSVSITADHDDAVGNDANQATASVLKDTIIPTVAITAPTIINNANNTTYTVAGSCSENGRTVTVSVGGVSGTPTCSAGAWSSTLNVSGVSDGVSVAITANHTDLAANAATQATASVVKDTANPTVAITSSPVINDANKAAYVVSGTCSENTRTVTVSVGGVAGSPTCTASAWSTTLDVTLVADNASVSITANHSDASGNNATQASASVLKDTAIPTVAISSSPVINNANRAAYIVSGTCSENSRTVTVNVGGVSSTPTCTTNTWSATLNVTAVGDGATVAITANHSDVAGNAATQATTSVLKDTVVPTVAITTPANINSGNASAYPLSGTCSENGRTVSVNVGGVTGTPTCTASAWSTNLNVSGIADAPSVAITANHSDAAGNNATQASASVIKSTGLPTVAITSSPAINNTNKNAYPLSGTCSENTRIVSINVGGVTATPTCTTNAWSASLNVSGLGDTASVAITADHDDLVGNDAVQAATTVLKDTVVPTVAITSSPAINNTNRTAYPVSGTCSENTIIVTVVVGGVSGTPTCTAGAWSTSLNVTGVTDNVSVAITANHSDAASNAATQASTNVVKDTVIPTVAISSAPSINNTNKAAYPVSGTCSENTRQVTVSVGGVSATPTCTGSAWSTSVDVTGVSDSATVTVTANHADASGNNATQASTTVVKDTAIPTVAISSSPAINNTNRTAYTVSGTCSENGRAVSVNVGGVTGSPSCTTLTWTTTLNVTGVSDGVSVSVTANHSDAAGNAATTASTTVVKDTVIPTVAITAPVAINNTNKAAYPISGTCSENTRTVTVIVGGVSGTPTCTTGAWSTSLNLTAVGDGGSIAITADHTDAVGNNATQATATTAKDTAIPTVAITSNTAINNTNKAAYPVSGTCSENSRTVTVVVGGVSATPTCSALAWSTSVNVTAVSDGASVAITADHTDAAGNAATQATTTVLKDTVIPTVAISSSPSINNANRTAYVVSGTCSENTRSVSVNVGSVSGSGTCTALAWSATLNVTTVTDGASVAVTADHTDVAGNPATQAATTVLKDTSNPTVAITSSPGINISNSAAYTVSGTCSENTRTVTVSVGGVSGTPTCTALTWSTTVNASGLADSGSVTITANHTDAAGNAATQASTTVIKDTAIPTVAITSSTAINNTNRAAYPVSGTCSENGRTVSVNVGGVTGTPTCTALAWSTSLNVTGVADAGAVAATADHTDAAGNSATQASTSFLKDTVIPTVAITSSPVINNANRAAYTVSGTCSENTRTVNVTVGGVAGTPTCTTLAWTTTLNVTAVADGASISITANHTDLAGNAATQASTTVVKDATIPTVAITSSPLINNANRAAYTVSGTCSENTRTVSVSVGGVAGTPTCSAGAWSSTLNVTAVGDGASISITADHSDVSGNNATQAATTVLKDTVIPTVAITSSPAINNTNRAAYPISGTCSENTRTVTVVVGSVSATPTCTALAWSASMNVTAVADNASVAVTANHSDAAGNAATQASTTVAKDTGLPTVAINSPSIINNANKASFTVNGTCTETGRTVSVMVGSVSATDTCTLLNWTVTVDVTALIDSASVLITADHTDAAGNNAVQAATSTVKDTFNPTVALNAAAAITNANRTAYTVSGTCSENTRTVTVSVGGVAASPACASGTWTTGAINVSAAVDSATLTITANHTDSAGNSATQASTTVVKDTTNPTVAITSSPTINIANRLAYTVSGTCTENTRTVTVSIGGVAATPTCSGGTWSTGAVNVTGASDSATLAITANHTDAVGNAATQASASVLKDTVAPTVAFASAAGNPVYAAFVVRALFSETVTGMLAGDFSVSNAATSGYTVVSGTAYDITVTPSVDGAVTVDMAAAAATDVAGNQSTAATQFTRNYQSTAILSFAVTSTHDYGSITTGGSADVTMVINKAGVANATSVTEISLAAPFAFKGGAFPGTGGTCSTTISGTCSIVVTFTPTAAGVRNDSVDLQYYNGSATVSISRAITGTGVVITPTLVDVTGPSGVMINQCIPFTISSKTAGGLTANVTANETVNLVVNNGAGGFFSDASCVTGATSTIITNGTSSRLIYFRATTANQNLTLVFNPTTLTSTTKFVSTSTAPTRIEVNPPLEFQANTCLPIVVDLVDAAGTKAGRAVAVQVNLTENGDAVFYSDSICSGIITSTTFPAFTETKTVYVMNPTVQATTLTFTDNAAFLTADSASVSFVSGLTWWNTSFFKRIPITLNNLDQAFTHTNIQVLVRLNSSRINYANTLAGGADIRFTLADHTTVLSYDIESWNAAGESLIWVRIPSISASTQRIIYMYYDNLSASTTENAAATWSGYSGVWNMDKTGANYIDATGSGKTGTPVGPAVVDTTGPTGRAISLSSSSSINTGFALETILGRTSTLSVWMRSTVAGNNTVWLAPGITGVEQGGGGNDIFFGHINLAGFIGITAGNGATTTSGFRVNDNNWRLVTMSRNETTGAVRFYTNGVLNGSGTSETGNKSTTFNSFGFVRNTGGASNFYTGQLDGIRMSNTILTDDRIRAEYKFSVETNIAYGAVENL
jgi:rRNA maturation protein Nop10